MRWWVMVVVCVACSAELGDGSTGTRRDGGADAGSDAAVTDGGAVDGGAMDAFVATDASSPDFGIDGGLPCMPEPRDCSASGVSEDRCVDITSCYVSNVQGAVRRVIRDNPTWFTPGDGCSIILDVDSFMDAVVADLTGRSGLCAIRDPNAPREEVTVKYSNAFAENFDIVASTGCARSGDAIYTSTCIPAWW